MVVARSPATGSGGGLTATITKGKCIDKTQPDTKEFPYQGQVYLPEGDTVNGCCRKLKPGEAPVGPHGISLRLRRRSSRP